MGVFFQAIHPVEYSMPIPQEMAEKLFNRAGWEACFASFLPMRRAAV